MSSGRFLKARADRACKVARAANVPRNVLGSFPIYQKGNCQALRGLLNDGGHPMKAGDFIGFSSYEPLSIFVNGVTFGLPYFHLSHVGVMAEYLGRLELFECTTLNNHPCIIQHKPFKGTQAVHLKDRLADYPGWAFRYPLYRPLYADESQRLTDFLVSRIGRPYDAIEAMESGGWLGILRCVASRMRVVPSRSYFCSKETAAAFSHVGLMPTDDPARWNPNKLVRHLRRNEILLRRRRLK